MSGTSFPHGVSSMGVPLPNAGFQGIPPTNGSFWFVDQAAGSDGYDGQGPGSAYASINQAIDAAQAGDVILVYPGSYEENVVVDKDYISIIGVMLNGYGKPDIVPTAGIAVLNQAAQGMVLQNLRTWSEDDDSIYVEGNGFVISGCTIDGDLTAAKGGIRLRGNADDDSYTASEGIIANNYIRGNAVGIIFDTGDAPDNGVGSSNNRILGNTFDQNTIDLAAADTGGGTYSVQFTQIGPGNQFMDKTKTCYIDLTTANGGAAADQSGIISANFFNTDTITTTNVKMVDTLFGLVGNFNITGVVNGTTID